MHNLHKVMHSLFLGSGSPDKWVLNAAIMTF